MGRKTINLPDSVETLVRDHSAAGESFSATAARLILAGAAVGRGRKPPGYVGSGEGPSDLGRMAERYLKKLAKAR